jgi:hypothetical protein
LDEYYVGREMNEEESKFIYEYLKYVPFIQTKCLMNNISTYMEENIKLLKDRIKINTTSDNIKILKDPDIEESKEVVKEVYALYKKYKTEKRNFMEVREDSESSKRKTVEQFNKYIRQEAYKISSDGNLLANIAIDICYTLHPSDNKSFVWNVFGNEVVENIMKNKQEHCLVPFEDKNGEIEYLGNYYSMVEIYPQKENYYEYL